jgi:FMN phosphatase YigB (HAD superfamily)
MSSALPVVFLFDVDNTLLNNDQVTLDLQHHLERTVGLERARAYWDIFERLRQDLGYADYLGSLQRFRLEFPHESQLLPIARFLIDYPFANRLFPGSLDALAQAERWGPAVILSDGDVVFQPRKIDRSGLFEAVKGQALIYVHKEQELAEVERRHPADHYVVVDDKLRILNAIKRVWGPKMTSVFVRQGHYAHDPKILAEQAPADITLERIGDLLEYDWPTLRAAAAQV